MSSSSNTKVTTVDSPGSNDTLGGGEKYITYMWEGLIEIQRHHGGKGEREGERGRGGGGGLSRDQRYPGGEGEGGGGGREMSGGK